MFSPAGILRYRSKENDFLIEAAYGWNSNVIARVVSPADASTPQGRAYISGEPVIARNLNAVNDLSRPAFHGKRGNTATAKLVLARELKHRDRNDLQLNLAMLDRHAATLDDGPPKHGIETIALRLMTMARLYDILLGAGMRIPSILVRT